MTIEPESADVTKKNTITTIARTLESFRAEVRREA